MPNRIIKESICTSEDIDQLTPFQETFFYRLLVNCDDYGCFDAREKVVASRLFPLRAIKPDDVIKTLNLLADLGMIVLYTVDEKPYLKVVKWADHQRVRVSKHKYPVPEDGEICNCLPQVAASCGELRRVAANGGKLRPESNPNPIQSNPNTNTNPNPNPNPSSGGRKENALDELFDLFWDVYPRKESKLNAKKAFDKIKPDRDLVDTMIQSVQRWKMSKQWQDSQFIPYPASWLNQRRWEDEIPGPAPQQKPQKVLPAQDFQQRSYDGVQDEILSNLSKEMAIFKATGEVKA